MDELVFDTTNLVFDIETEINSTSSDKDLILMVGFVEEDGMCLVRSYPGLKAGGSIVFQFDPTAAPFRLHSCSPTTTVLSSKSSSCK